MENQYDTRREIILKKFPLLEYTIKAFFLKEKKDTLVRKHLSINKTEHPLLWSALYKPTSEASTVILPKLIFVNYFRICPYRNKKKVLIRVNKKDLSASDPAKTCNRCGATFVTKYVLKRHVSKMFIVNFFLNYIIFLYLEKIFFKTIILCLSRSFSKRLLLVNTDWLSYWYWTVFCIYCTLKNFP